LIFQIRYNAARENQVQNKASTVKNYIKLDCI